MNRIRLALAVLAAGALASVALGQNADKNSAGPTKNDYRLKVLEPAEGATIAGPTVRVVVNTEIRADGGETRKDVDSMPRPYVDVFLDNDLKGTMRDVTNVLEIDSVPAGTHKLVLLAKNKASEIIDRKEVKFLKTDGGVATGTTGADDSLVRNTAPPASDRTISETAPLFPAASSTSAYDHSMDSTQSPLLTASAQAPPAARQPSSEPADTTPRTLPATASSDPAFALAGAALLLAGISIRRLV